MPADKKFLAKSIQKKDHLIVAYSSATNMPFIVCDPETRNDQVWLFDTQEELQAFSEPYTEQKIALKGVSYQNKNFLSFFSTLFTLDVNELVLVSGNEPSTLALEDLVQRPDYSSLPKEQQPILNPELQLTGLYFMQEASRPVPREEKTRLPELEEELSADLLKAHYIIPIQLMDGPEPDEEKLKKRKYRMPILKNQKDDSIMQPAFTDPTEFRKFSKEGQLRAMVVPFGTLVKLLVKESKGIMLNPMGFHLMLTRELLEGLQAQS